MSVRLLDLSDYEREMIQKNSFFIVISSFEYDEKLKTYGYMLKYGEKDDLGMIRTHYIKKRFSEILDLFDILGKTVPEVKNIALPPKIWFFRNDPAKIEKRVKILVKSFYALCCLDLRKNQDFRKFFELC